MNNNHIVTEQFKMSHQMTLQEYQTEVTLFLKEYFKFIRKNSKFFTKKDFYGLEYVTWNEYLNSAKLNSYYTTEDHVRERWIYKTQHEPEQASDELIDKYSTYIESLSKIFTAHSIKGFENDEVKSNKRSVKRAIDKDLYQSELMDGVITPEQLQNVVDSLSIKLPKRVLDMKSKVETQGYSRSMHDTFLQSSKEFEILIREELKPHTNMLELRYIIPIEKIVDEYITFCSDQIKFKKSISEYASRKSRLKSQFENDFEHIYTGWTEEFKLPRNFGQER